MGRLTILLAVTICLAHFVHANHEQNLKMKRPRRPFPRNDEHCKREGVSPSHYFMQSDMCTYSNSEMTMEHVRQPGRWQDAPNVHCTCHESGWLRCFNHGGRRRPQFGKRPSSRRSQQGISYEENPRCYDGNSENRSPGCTKKTVVLVKADCRCHEQGWNRCENYSSTTGTTVGYTTAAGTTSAGTTAEGTTAAGSTTTAATRFWTTTMSG
ncbi:unnamed protein product [Allacma fusca]|uniref:Uncharacterized protein n=1 Tax=Allacma fusca TaxID=39272 RepID=A0A8J2JU44_9HEXA|nr:unnamed protein product [Allacma fusca]